MSTDPIRSLVQIASGITELTVTRATETARDLAALVGLDEDLTSQKLATRVSRIAEELRQAAADNHRQLVELIRSEVERSLARADLAKVADLDAARTSMATLMAQMEDLRTRMLAFVPSVPGVSAPADGSAAPAPRTEHAPEAVSPSSGRRRPPRRTFAGSSEAPAATKKAATKKTTAKKAATKKTPAKKTTTKKTPAKKTTAKKATAAKAATKKTTAKKAAE